MPTIKIEDAKFNPTKYFKRPMDVLKEDRFSREEKIDILQSWKYDELDKAVAEEENMPAPVHIAKRSNYLEEISKALIDLGVEVESGAPTKQG